MGTVALGRQRAPIWLQSVDVSYVILQCMSSFVLVGGDLLTCLWAGLAFLTCIDMLLLKRNRYTLWEHLWTDHGIVASVHVLGGLLGLLGYGSSITTCVLNASTFSRLLYGSGGREAKQVRGDRARTREGLECISLHVAVAHDRASWQCILKLCVPHVRCMWQGMLPGCMPCWCMPLFAHRSGFFSSAS